MALKGSKETNIMEGLLRCTVPSTCMSHTIIYKYLCRHVATSTTISNSIKRTNGRGRVATTGTKPTSRDTLRMLASLHVLLSLEIKPLSLETPTKISDCAGVEGRNCDNLLQSIYETNGIISPSSNSRNPFLIFCVHDMIPSSKPVSPIGRLILVEGAVEKGCGSILAFGLPAASLVVLPSKFEWIGRMSVTSLVLPYMAISIQDHLFPATWLKNVRRLRLALE